MTVVAGTIKKAPTEDERTDSPAGASSRRGTVSASGGSVESRMMVV